MTAWLIPGPPGPAVMTEERCAITELLNDPACPEVSLALAEVAPGVTTRLHALVGTLEVYVLIEGEGRVEVDGVAADVRAGDRVVIAPGLSQRITNTGRGVLRFHCVCRPRFEARNYRDIDG